MEFEPDIAKLEKIVVKLLDEYDVVKRNCEQLTLDLEEATAKIDELKEENITFLNEKDTVHSRVTSILGKLSDWETGLAKSSADDSDTGAKDAGGQLFSMGSTST